MIRTIRVVLAFAALLSCAAAQSSPSWSNDPQTEARIDALLKQMTLEEKIGQLVTYSAGAPTGPGTGRSDYKEMIAKGQLGSLFNLTGAAETNEIGRASCRESE